MVRGVKSSNFLLQIVKQRAVEKCPHADIETVAQLFDRYDAGVRRSSVDDIAHRGLRNPGDVADLVDRYVPFAAQLKQPFHSVLCFCIFIPP